MTENEYKRSKEPIFWGLFGFGGMVISFAFPALLICMIIAGITGDFSHFKIVDIMKHWWGAGALFLIIMGFIATLTMVSIINANKGINSCTSQYNENYCYENL